MIRAQERRPTPSDPSRAFAAAPDVLPLRRGRYEVRAALCETEVKACQRLRARSFALNADLDADGYDDGRTQIFVEDLAAGRIVACCRLRLFDAPAVQNSYAAQFYDLSPLESFTGPVAELGRFCVDLPRADPDVIRLIWAAITACVEAHSIRLLFGCTSFAGVRPDPYLDTFAILRNRHLGPARWRPRAKSRQTVRFPDRPSSRAGLRNMPSLLRSYLTMGGWVGDHAVIDPALNTLHVFTALETASVPAARQRLLRGLF